MKEKNKIILIITIIALIVLGLGIYLIVKNITASDTKELTKEQSIKLLNETYADRNYTFEFKEENKNYYVYEVKDTKFQKEEYWVKKDGSDIEQHVSIAQNF